MGLQEEHQQPQVRVCEVVKGESPCGFHLTRTKWDPYPWVYGVDPGSPAADAGLRVGDCVLEVNGEDVLGQRVSDIAARVRSQDPAVTMLLWNSGVDPDCDPESLCCGPMPTSLQRLSSCVNAILTGLECPVCLDTIPPPANQCANGHLMCQRCRSYSDRCPVCRHRLGRGRSLLADKVYNSLTEAFHLKEEPLETRAAKMKQRLNGKKKIPDIQIPVAEIKPTPKNKFLTRILGKSSSVENLSTKHKSSSSLSVDLEFQSNLKSKSLSSNEIFNHLSPAVSQVSVMTSTAADIGFSSSRSFQGSLESLTQRMITDFVGDSELTDDGACYYCPYTADCTSRLKRPSMFRHLQYEHAGPLVQYFSLPIATDLPPFLPDNAIISVTHDGSVYFLKIEPKNRDFHVWLWVLGKKFKADTLRLIVTLRTEELDSPELTFKSAVDSLAASSWSDVVDGNKGVVIKKDVIDATFENRKLKLYISVKSIATQPTAV